MRALIVVHSFSPAGGRVITIKDEVAGFVCDDQGLIELLQQAGAYNAERWLDDPHWIEWRGWPHRYEGA
ncbi:hypothetical protein ACWGN9_03860 [Streptomyces sp. NPDC055775]